VPVTFTLDTAAPMVIITAPAPGLVSRANVTVVGRVTDNLSGIASLQSQFDASPAQSVPFDASGNYSFDTTLPLDGSADGTHTVSLRATDQAGNQSALAQASFILDTTPPTVTLTSPAAGAVSTTDVTVSGRVNDTLSGVATLEAQLDTGAFTPVMLDASGNFSFPAGLALDGSADGSHTVSLRATDKAGNSGMTPASFTLETGLLSEGTAFHTSREQDFTIPAGPSMLSFTYKFLSFDTNSQPGIRDAFEAALVDANGQPLVHTIGTDRDAFLNLTDGQPSALGAETTVNGTTVNVNLAGITPGTSARLIDRLINNESDGTPDTSVDVLPAQILPNPGGQPIAVIPGAAALAFAPTVDLSALSDVSTAFTPEYGQTAFDEADNVLYADLVLRNTGQYPVDKPLVVAVDHLSDPTVRVRGADGMTPDGLPYYNLSGLVPGQTLNPGDTTGMRRLAFFNPNRTPFTYDLVVLGQLNRPPAFTTQPNTEAIPDVPYVYQAAATDPDGDPLHFTLLTGPAGMAVDAATGKVTWSPQQADLGTHTVALRVDDGRGGTAEQDFIVNAIVAPPNRPPVFTSTPVVDANVATLYTYQATASDPDGGETLTFSVVSGPQGLHVDGSSGLVTWMPSVGQLGTDSVTLQVDDGRGGAATQAYTIAVAQQPGNQPPLITSSPQTTVLAGQTYRYAVHALDADNDPLTYSLTAGPSGMTIDGASGQVTWPSIASQDAGPHNVGVQVADGRGGVDTQNYVLTVSTGQPGSVSGTVYNDLNGNGQRDGTAPSPPQLDPITLVSAGVNSNVLDYHQPTNSILTLTQKGGILYLERILPDGTEVDYASFPRTNYLDDMSITAVQEGNTAGFTVGDVFVANSFPSINDPNRKSNAEIYRVPNGGGTITDAWVTLPTVERIAQVYLDRTGVFGDDLLALTAGSSGQLWKIDAAGNAHLLATHIDQIGSFGQGSMITIPNDPATYGPLAGTLLVTTDGGPSLTVDPTGHVEAHPLQDEQTGGSILPESVTIASSTENLFFSTDNVALLVAASAAQIAPIAGDLILSLESGFPSGAGLYRLYWDGTTLQTQPLPFAKGSPVPQAWEKVVSMPAPYLQLATPPVEPGLANWVVYLDQNGNGRRDPGEPFTTTDANGRYTFDNLSPASYTVALEGQPGWKETAPAEQTHVVNLAAGQVLTGVDFATTQLNVAPGNRAPVFTSTPPTTAVVGRVYQYQPVVSNPDGVPLTFDLPVKPSGMVIDPATGFISWLPTLDEAGIQNVIARVQDGRGGVDLQQFQITAVVVSNTAPVISSSPPGPAGVGLPYQYQVQAQDRDGDPLKFQLNTVSPGMTIDPNTGLLTWPSAALDYSNAVLADNPAGFWRLNETSGTVAADSSPNHLDGTYGSHATLGAPGPLANNPEPAVSGIGTGFDVSVPDADILKPTQVTLEAWVDSSAHIVFGGTVVEKRDHLNDYGLALDPNTGDPGSIVFYVQDINSAQVETHIPAGQWSYVVGTYNGTTVNLYVNGQLAGSLDYHATLAYGSSNLLLGGWTGSLANVAVYDTALSADQVRAHYLAATVGPRVAITASDGRGAETTQAFNLAVVLNPTNHPPVITSTPPTRIRLGGLYQYVVQGADPDGDPLTFTLTKAPAGMTINAQGQVTWRPSSAQLGDNAVEVQADDGRGGSATQDFTVTVVSFATSLAPQIVSTPPLAAILGQGYEYDAQATDPAGAPIAWSLDSAPAGMIVDRDQGIVRWTPTIFQLGADPVVLRVLDNQGNTATQAFTVVVRGANVPPMITSVPPTQAYAGQHYTYAVQATEPEHEPLTFGLPTAPAMMTIDAVGMIRWTPGTADVGSTTVTLQVDDGQGGIATQTYTLVVGAVAPNPPPVITSAAPLQATVGQVYQYMVQASDPDGDPLHFALPSSPAGMTIDAASGLVQWTPTASQVGANVVSVAAVDPPGGVGQQNFTIAVIAADQPPTITSSPVTTVTAGLAYHYDVQATDPDGDTLTYALSGDTRGLSVDSLGRISGPTASADVGVHHLVVTVTDSHGTSATQPYDLTVTADTEAPQVHLSVSSNPVNVGSAVTFVVTATDDVGVQTIGLTVGGSPVPLDANGRATLTMNTVEQVDVVATATDAAGNMGTATSSLTVINPNVAGAPTVALTTPADGAMISAPTDVIGTASDPNLLFYQVDVAPVGSDAFIEVFRGTASVTNGTLGKFDPSMLQNDSYVLRLTAENAGGISASTEATVSVMGNLKLGNFTLAFTDLSVPVSGIPITLTRTYDTMQANQSEDFGFGWRLDYRDVRLRTSVPKTGEEANGIFNGFRDGTRVYVTLPGGKREGFTFCPTSEFIAGTVYQPNICGDPGVTDQLTVTGETSNQGLLGVFQNVAGQNGAITLYLGPDGSYTNDAGIPYNPADSLFGGTYFLTTKDGTQYQIDAFSGKLQAIADPNGNTLTFTEAGISSSTGPALKFARNPQGRIVSITDPLGQSLTYQYGAIGDLVAVTDRMGNTTQLAYRSDRPHYLDHVTDPLGHTGLRSDYDAQGRLKQVTNADNQAVQVAYDPSHDTETVLDPLNNPTVYVYDDRGNVLSVTDALNGITQYTYNTNNNVQSKIDPLNHTTAYTYDVAGNMLTETAAQNNVRRFTYAPNSQPLTITDGLGDTTSISYNAAGDPLTVTDPTGRALATAFDSSGNVTMLTYANGGAYHLTYDGAGRLMHQVDALGNATEFTYDASGNRRTETVSRTISGVLRTLTTTYGYDANDRLTSVTDPLGGVSQFEYNTLGLVSARVDGLGRRTTYDYDPAGRLTQTTFPDGTVEMRGYDAAGNQVQLTDQAGHVTTYGYDPLNRLISTTFADDTPSDPTDNPREQTIYDAAGNVKARIDANGNRTDYDYDPAGRLLLTVLPPVLDSASGAMVRPEVRDEYDAAGNLTATIDADGHRTRFGYDAAGRLTTTLYPDSTSTQVQYDPVGRVSARTDQEGRTTSYGYDMLGRLLSVTLPPPAAGAAAPVTRYAYDEAGNLLTQTDALNRTTQFSYDELNRLVETVLPLGQAETLGYDLVGNEVRRTDFNGVTTTFTYDSMNRLAQKLYPDSSTVAFTYTPTGQPQTVTDSRGTTLYAYDVRGRLTSRTDPDGRTIAYAYDAVGNETSVTVASGTTAYTYDRLNRMETVTDPAGGVTNYFYDAAGNLVRTALPDGTVETRQYDDLNRLVSLQTNEPGGAVLSSYHYTLSRTGVRSSVREDTGRTVTYTYDGDYRLTSESIVDPTAGNRTIAYTYDAVGNLLTQNDSAEGETTYVYDANDRLQTETLSGAVTDYSYDNNGNLLSRVSGPTDTASYSWDFENRLVGADVTDTSGTQHVTYQYDPDGNRVAQTVGGAVTRFLVDTNRPLAQVLEEYTAGGAVQTAYVYGLRLILQNRGGVQFFYHVDGLGSTRLLTDVTGQAVGRYVYTAFGRHIQQTGSIPNSYLFAGEQLDANLGLYYLRARYYDPLVGRFTRLDSFPGQLNVPLSLHRYIYAADDPVNHTDPSGEFSLGELAIVSVTFGLLATALALKLNVAGEKAALIGALAGIGLFTAGFGYLALTGGLPAYLTGVGTAAAQEEIVTATFAGGSGSAGSAAAGGTAAGLPTVGETFYNLLIAWVEGGGVQGGAARLVPILWEIFDLRGGPLLLKAVLLVTHVALFNASQAGGLSPDTTRFLEDVISQLTFILKL
jgi:RHS repeat-associated protein